jgi:hypothetical protein
MFSQASDRFSAPDIQPGYISGLYIVGELLHESKYHVLSDEESLRALQAMGNFAPRPR